MAVDAQLRVERSSDGIAFIGEIDAHTAHLVRDALMSPPVSGDLRIDLSGVTFIDSSGLRVLLEARQAAESDGRQLCLVDPSHPVLRLIEIAGLTSHLRPAREPAAASASSDSTVQVANDADR